MSEWQTIETAPDQEEVLVANPESGRLPVIARKIEGEWFLIDVRMPRLRPPPTHWTRWPKLPRVQRT